MNMDSRYDHLKNEEEMTKLWETLEAFNPDKSDNRGNKPFTIIMPPPNANDPLHVGHAMFISIEDILVRYHRMLGDDTLWLPGADHAGIETQYVYEKKLKKKGRSRFDFDRETLYQNIWNYVQEKSDVAMSQIKKLGASVDWSRFKFTLGEDVVDDVLNTFSKLDSEGLVYRANRLVNYCTNCGTAFSNLEVLHQEQKSTLYYIKYGPLVVATTRPETRFADVALAVHPKDKRYKKYVDKTLQVEGVVKNYSLPVIADDFVDPKFGTGVVKITPYHDHNDFDFWQRHKDEIKTKPTKAINYDGFITEAGENYKGLKASQARKKLVKDLKKADLIEKVDLNYQNNMGLCYRCKKPIEPLPLTQFYVKVKPLTEPVLEALDKGEIVVHGAGHDKILKHWLEILEDWNISRQVVWGIRIPVWYNVEKCPDIQTTYLGKNGKKHSGKISKLLKNDSLETIKQGLQTLSAPLGSEYKISKVSPGNKYIQETDTFDTWFSSSQWPVVTLKNNQPDDFDRFYPTQVMETGYDILMFWVMRMLMMGEFITGKLPFNNVYLHGLIRDDKGEKMSKSKNNVTNPLQTTEKYGADALRMALVIRSSAGLDKSVGKPDFKAARNLTNKIWNAARYILMSLDKKSLKEKTDKKYDQVFEEHLKQIIESITKQINDFKIGLAAETLYNEFWHWFCDECIEKCKKEDLSQSLLLKGLTTFLKLLHPFTPFVTEKLWQILKQENLVEDQTLALSNWP
ncbi:MAG: valine--tRNA ligase [Patescibacteria group bacterium]|nr:valine--tRNA ligase [Patescibacteria group bacterium]